MSNVEFFRDEIGLIENRLVRGMVEKILPNIPAYIWTIGASKSGNYHPPEDNDDEGLIWHLRKTAWVAYRMFSNLLYSTDVGIIAGLLHDIAHRGIADEPEEGYDNYQAHGEVAAELLACMTIRNEPCTMESIGKDIFDYVDEPENMYTMDEQREAAEIWTAALGCIRSHMGRWGRTKPLTVEQQTFHLADVAASTVGLVSVHYLTGVCGDKAWSNYSIDELVGRRRYLEPDEDGELRFAFGKKGPRDDKPGQAVSYVLETDPGYIRWLLKVGTASTNNPKGFPGYFIRQLEEAKERFEQDRRARMSRNSRQPELALDGE